MQFQTNEGDLNGHNCRKRRYFNKKVTVRPKDSTNYWDHAGHISDCRYYGKCYNRKYMALQWFSHLSFISHFVAFNSQLPIY